MPHSKNGFLRSAPIHLGGWRASALLVVALLAACQPPDAPSQRAAGPGAATAAADAPTGLPSFEDYPATTTFEAEPAPVDLDSHPQARSFRTALTRDAEAGAEEARFAGHYRVVVIGCGTSCKSVWAVDLRDGSVHSLFTASYGVAFRPDSRLIIENDPAAYERLLDVMPAEELEQLIATYGPPRFWVEKDGAFEPIGPREVELDAARGRLVAASASTDSPWQCANDLEISCGGGGCEAAATGAFTPMRVTADGSGALSVCAYSGCWEGTAKVLQSGEFLILAGHGFPFSTAEDPRFGTADIAVVIDRADGFATLKTGEFALPLSCERNAAS